MIILRIAVRGPDETPVRAPKALVLILDFCYKVMLSNSIKIREKERLWILLTRLVSDQISFAVKCEIKSRLTRMNWKTLLYNKIK